MGGVLARHRPRRDADGPGKAAVGLYGRAEDVGQGTHHIPGSQEAVRAGLMPPVYVVQGGGVSVNLLEASSDRGVVVAAVGGRGGGRGWGGSSSA